MFCNNLTGRFVFFAVGKDLTNLALKVLRGCDFVHAGSALQKVSLNQVLNLARPATALNYSLEFREVEAELQHFLQITRATATVFAREGYQCVSSGML